MGLAGLLSCSKVGVGYSIGSKLVQNKVDDAFDFKPKAKSKGVDQFLSAEFKKKRKIFFIRAKSLVLSLQLLSQKDPITDSDAEKLYQEVGKFQKDMIQLFRPSFQKVMTEVGDAELKVFNEYSVEQMSEKEEQVNDLKSFKKKKHKNIERLTDFLLDDVTSNQEKLIEKFVAKHIDFYKLHLQIRKKFDTDLIKIYPEKDKMIDLSIAYYSGDPAIRSDIYNKQREIFESEMRSMILEIWKLRTPSQKNFFQQRLTELLKEIEKVIAEN